MSASDRPCVVIDTNVLMVAEGNFPEASDLCLASCVDLAMKVENGLAVALDSGDEIVNEYLTALKSTKRSGLATKLVTKLYRLRQNPNSDIVRSVSITRSDDPPGSYEEVPTQLRDFDLDDQKFIAVAAAEASRPQIHTAVDGEWWTRRRDFAEAGIDVQFACTGDFLGVGNAAPASEESVPQTGKDQRKRPTRRKRH